MGWQTIDSAPHDGTEIIIGAWVNGEWRICQSSYQCDAGINTPDAYEPSYWYWACDADWGGITDFPNPTHWMPLTQPTKEQQP